MINPKELRLGNWVICNNQYVLIESFNHASQIRYQNGVIGLKASVALHPIPLTENILVKCGFTYYAQNNSWQWDSDLGFRLWGRVETGISQFKP